MARNSEKAMTTLARWRAAHIENKTVDRRPYLATECMEVHKCEKWRRQIVSEISRKVAQIQNAGLGEFRLRDLNDEINKLLREKGHWEDQIKELGGPDYRKIGPRMLDREGKEVPGNRGYKYFGAAKDLPGVRELFEQAPPPPPRKARAELMRDVDADYYGYRDDDDGVLLPLEKQHEKEVVARLLTEWKSKKEAIARGEITERIDKTQEDEDDIYRVTEHDSDSEAAVDDTLETDDDKHTHFIAHVPVPSQKEVEEALLQRKKMELLQKYASDTLQSGSEETKKLMGLSS